MQTHSKTREFRCETCQKKFTREDALKRHLMIHKNEISFDCPECGKKFGRKDNMLSHLSNHTRSFTCSHCEEVFTTKQNLKQHMKVKHPKSSKRKLELAVSPNKRQRVLQEAFDVFTVHSIYPSNPEVDLLSFFNESKLEIKSTLINELELKGAMKWYLTTQVVLSRMDVEENEERISPHFRSKCMVDLTFDTIESNIDQSIGKMLTSFEEFIQRGSQWELIAINHLEVRTAKYHPLAASSYIPLPKKISTKKGVLNIQNLDTKCLIWCLLAHKYKINRKNDPHRITHYLPHENEIKLGNVECPVPISKISVIEQLNDIRINVFGFEEEVFPLYISKRSDEDCINLLLISSEDKKHYCLIRSMSRLLGDVTKHNGASFYCYRCLHRFSEKRLLSSHLTYCKDHSIQRIEMPSEQDKLLNFKNIHYQHPVPFIIYADFEAIITPISTCQWSESKSFTEKISRHDPCGYAYIVVDDKGKSVKPIQVYRGEDAISHFL